MGQSNTAKQLPVATYRGTLVIGPVEIPCAVLDDGRRMLSERGIADAFGNRSGAAKRLKSGGAPLPVFLGSKRLLPYISRQLALGPFCSIRYCIGDRIIQGYEASCLPETCEIWLRARDDGRLTESQLPRAQIADLIIRGLSKVGVIALIDEVTGYQDVRTKNALRVFLDKYFTKTIAAWTKRFPDEFYREIARLKGWHENALSVTKPGIIGKITNDVIYERLCPGSVEELKKLNPITESGYRARKHHQHLTEQVGHPALAQHLHPVICLMRSCNTWGQFMAMLNRAFPKQKSQVELLLD